VSVFVVAGFEGGPADGARLRVRVLPSMAVVLVAWRNEIHGYRWDEAGGRYRHQCLLATTTNGAPAVDVLRKHGRGCVEIREEGGGA